MVVERSPASVAHHVWIGRALRRLVRFRCTLFGSAVSQRRTFVGPPTPIRRVGAGPTENHAVSRPRHRKRSGYNRIWDTTRHVSPLVFMELQTMFSQTYYIISIYLKTTFE